MSRSIWLNRVSAWGVLFILALGVGMGCAKPQEQPTAEVKLERPQTEAPKPEQPDPGSAVLAERILEAKKTSARLGCMSIAQAVDAYQINASNPDGDFPTKLDDLVQPPFGGASFLRNGKEDTLDPWGKPFQWKKRTRPDGSEYMFVTCVAPDGMLISQFGIGPKAEPKK